MVVELKVRAALFLKRVLLVEHWRSILAALQRPLVVIGDLQPDHLMAAELHLFLIQLEVENVGQLPQRFKIGDLWHDCMALAKAPVENHLQRRLVVLYSELQDSIVDVVNMLDGGMIAVGAPETSDGVDRDGQDVPRMEELHDVLLVVLGVELDLVAGRQDPSVAQQVHQQVGVEVAQTNASSQLFVYKELHFLPNFVQWKGVLGGYRWPLDQQ